MKPSGAHTHPDSGSGIVLVVLVVIAAAAVAGPVIDAVAELVRVVLIVAAVVLGLAVLGGAALVAYRLRQRQANAPRVVSVSRPTLPRPSQALPGPRPELERAREVHLHLHGVSAGDVAAIIRQRQDGAWPVIEED